MGHFRAKNETCDDVISVETNPDDCDVRAAVRIESDQVSVSPGFDEFAGRFR
jgi:hypothetical protein